MGTVYKAFDPARARVVCVRVLSPELLADAPRLERFRRDLKTSAALVHDNLLRTYGEGRDGDLVYAVAEYVDGGALTDRQEGSRLTLAEAIRVLRGVADGLGAAHRAGLVHGDLSPRHVFVSKDLSVVKVGGFGTAGPVEARAAARTTTLALARVVSELYRAPELINGDGSATVRCDIYSLGVIAYEAMTGKLPVGRFSLPSDVNNQVPLRLDPIVLKCLATDPANRYQSVAALVADLDTVVEVVDLRLLSEVTRLSGGRLFGTKKIPNPLKTQPARLRKFVVPAALALAAVATIVGLLLRGPGGLLPRVDLPGTAAAPGDPATAAERSAPGADPRAAASPDQAPLPSEPVTSAPAAAPLPSSALPNVAIVMPPTTASAPLSPPAPGPPAPSPRAPGRSSAPAPAGPAASAATPAGSGRASAAPAPGAGPAIPAETPAVTRPPRAADQRAAGNLFTEARSLINRGKDVEARAKLAVIGENHSQTNWFVPAMMVKIDLEDRLGLREPDPAVGQAVPASVHTKVLLTQRAPLHSTSEAALWQLGEFYNGVQQYPMAVQAYVHLATRFPTTRLEAWFRAGEIIELRLKNGADARAAYLKVPPTSARFGEAQERARRLAGR